MFITTKQVSIHPEGLATDKIDPGFPWLSSVLQQMLNWYQNFTLNCWFLMQPSRRKYQNSVFPRSSKLKILAECGNKTLLNFSGFTPLVISLSSPLPIAKPYLQLTFIRRTSGHYPGTFMAQILSLLPL